jgi:ATP/maltotriose-dependent transcriptional regulator MalT
MTKAPIIITHPGMGCSTTEFYVSENETLIIENNRIKPFAEISEENRIILQNEINSDQLVFNALFEMHPESEMKRLEQFTRCRLGGLDYQADIIDGKLQDGEYWECPERGTCKSEGILCKLPTYNGKRLEMDEIKLLQLTSTNKINEVIAEDLNLPLGTLHKFKKSVYKKLGIQTKQEGVVISFFLNLIQF